METPWNVIGASVTGTSHKKNETPCQDAHHFSVLDNGILLMAVADGAGSAPRSSEGSKCAVNYIIGALKNILFEAVPENPEGWHKLLTHTFSSARQAVIDLANQEADEPAKFATTLTVAIAKDDWLVTGQIGDGIVVAQSDAGEIFTASHPQDGEYAGETYFLTMDGAMDNFEGRIYKQRIKAVAALTDGLLRLALQYPLKRPHQPFFTPLFDFSSQVSDRIAAEIQLLNFLTSSRINARTDDDKTLVLATHQSVKKAPKVADANEWEEPADTGG